MKTIVIGDIHGQIDKLNFLLSHLEPDLESDSRVVFLGDYIDGGMDSRLVIQRLLHFRERHTGQTVFLKGNHEQWLLQSLRNPTKHSWIISMQGLNTIESYSPSLAERFRGEMRSAGPELITDNKPLPYEELEKVIPADHMGFFRNLALSYEDEHVICTHAGVSKDFKGLERESERQLVWGNDAFPEHYEGASLLVYGHFSNRSKVVNDRAVLYSMNNTICIDSSKLPWLVALELPGKILRYDKSKIKSDVSIS